MLPSDPALLQLQGELERIKATIKEQQKAQADTTLCKACEDVAAMPSFRPSCKHLLRGHIDKVNCAHYCGDSRHIVSGSLDGKLIIWDAFTGHKTKVIPLVSAWVMSCAFAPSGNFVASGGMDNVCTVHSLKAVDERGRAQIVHELLCYAGFLSCCCFVDDQNLLTGSGDMKACHHDLSSGRLLHEYVGHSGSVTTLASAPDGGRTFLTGSVDCTIKLWDVRTPMHCKQTFWGHRGDVNCVTFHPSGGCFVTASDDKTSRLWDLRSDQQVCEYTPPTPDSAFTSCGVSKSGRVLLSGSDDRLVHMWDVLKGTHLGMLAGHQSRVSSVCVAPSGLGVATASWDNTLRVWAA